MKAIPIQSYYYRVLDEDFYAALRAVTTKANISDNDNVAFKIALRSAVGSGLTLKEREAGLREADRISSLHTDYAPFFKSLAGCMRCKDADIEPMRSLADFYLWRKAGRPSLTGVRYGNRPKY